MRFFYNILFLLLGVFLGLLANDKLGITLSGQSIQTISPKTTISNTSVTKQETIKEPELALVLAPPIKPQVVVIDDYAPEQLMRKSKVAIQSAQYQQALVHIENLLTQVQDIYPQQDIEKIFVNATDLYLQQIGENKPKEKIFFLNKAIDILPNEPQFHYLLATLFLSLGEYSQVQYQLSFLVNDVKWKKQFDALQGELDYAEIFQQGEIEIPLIKLPNAWHIEVVVNDTPARFVLDTGASITTLSKHLLASDYSRLGVVVLSTANGTINAFRAALKTLMVGAVSKHNFPVVVLPQEKLPKGIDGLLGLDWLKNFDFVIDRKHSILRLTPIANKD
jgi:clan AA aspartic protease (TIGR02281 family)